MKRIDGQRFLYGEYLYLLSDTQKTVLSSVVLVEYLSVSAGAAQQGIRKICLPLNTIPSYSNNVPGVAVRVGEQGRRTAKWVLLRESVNNNNRTRLAQTTE